MPSINHFIASHKNGMALVISKLLRHRQRTTIHTLPSFCPPSPDHIMGIPELFLEWKEVTTLRHQWWTFSKIHSRRWYFASRWYWNKLSFQVIISFSITLSSLKLNTTLNYVEALPCVRRGFPADLVPRASLTLYSFTATAISGSLPLGCRGRHLSRVTLKVSFAFLTVYSLALPVSYHRDVNFKVFWLFLYFAKLIQNWCKPGTVEI